MQATRTQLMQRAATQLHDSDPFLAPHIARFGVCTIQPHTNYYQELVQSIIGQQLSVKAAAAIWEHFLLLFDGRLPMPQDIAITPVDKLRTAGLSRAKAEYVLDLAQRIMDGRLHINKLPDLSNEEVMQELTAIKGVGEWTAHMFLMFCLGRLDVLAVGDLGIRKGIQRLYELPGLPTGDTVRHIAATYNWQPYQTVACWYVWQSVDTA